MRSDHIALAILAALLIFLSAYCLPAARRREAEENQQERREAAACLASACPEPLMPVWRKHHHELPQCECAPAGARR